MFTEPPATAVLMLDDLHELQSTACRDVLSVVISGIPRGSQLVAASRSEQTHLPRLRASGDALEFLGSDLALDAGGTERIFAELGVSLTPELAAAVTERTEGWPAGLYLAALMAHDSNGEALTVSGEDRYAADDLYRESLIHLPETIQRFLRYTAVLDQLCAPLCDALLAESGAQERLRMLEASSLFVVALIVGDSGTATTHCSGSSCSASFFESSPTSSTRWSCAPPTGTSPMDHRRLPSSIC